MTVSKTILEKAKEFKKWNEWDTSTSAEFADSLTTELQKENARLRKELQQIQEQHVEFNNGAWYRSTAGAALSKEKE